MHVTSLRAGYGAACSSQHQPRHAKTCLRLLHSTTKTLVKLLSQTDFSRSSPTHTHLLSTTSHNRSLFLGPGPSLLLPLDSCFCRWRLKTSAGARCVVVYSHINTCACTRLHSLACNRQHLENDLYLNTKLPQSSIYRKISGRKTA